MIRLDVVFSTVTVHRVIKIAMQKLYSSVVSTGTPGVEETVSGQQCGR